MLTYIYYMYIMYIIYIYIIYGIILSILHVLSHLILINEIYAIRFSIVQVRKPRLREK